VNGRGLHFVLFLLAFVEIIEEIYYKVITLKLKAKLLLTNLSILKSKSYCMQFSFF